MASYVYSSANTGFSFFLDNLVTSAPNEGLLKITLQTSPGGLDYAAPTLAVASTTTDAGDYVGGSVGLASLSGLLETMSDRDMLVGDTGEFGNIAILSGSSTPLNYLRVNSAGTANEWGQLQVGEYALSFAPFDILSPVASGGSISVNTDEQPVYANSLDIYRMVTSTTANYSDQGTILVGDGTTYTSISPTITGSVPTYNGTDTVWQYPNAYTAYVDTTTTYPTSTGGASSVNFMTGAITGGTFLYNVLVGGTVSLPSAATLVFRPNMYVTTSGAHAAGEFRYWIGSNVAVGSQYNTAQFYDVSGANPIVFSPNIPVLVSSLANASLTEVRVYVENTYAATFSATAVSIDTRMEVALYPYGLPA